MQLERLNSTEQLLAHAMEWDRLWARSDVARPTARAELVAQWVECFGSSQELVALVVREGGELVGALPLVTRRAAGFATFAELTCNDWSPNGALLLDPLSDTPQVVRRLAEGLTELPWHLAWMTQVPLASPGWRALLEALGATGLATEIDLLRHVGRVETEHDFDAYLAARTRRTRKSLRRHWRRLERMGPVYVSSETEFGPHDVDRALEQVFAVEDRSWKGRWGTSVLRAEGMFEFFRRQAHQLARWGYLRTYLLECSGRPVASEIGWLSKGVYHSSKIGYDEAFRRFSPGQLLTREVIGQCFKDPMCLEIDFHAPLTPAMESWVTDSYACARITVAKPAATSRALMLGYRAVKPAGKRLLRAVAAARSPR